jgi:tetratricopeptide (TPR) repeat protein
MRRVSLLAILCLGLSLSSISSARAAGTWFGITSPNFEIWAESNNGPTRSLVWQIEQVRHVAKTLWPWMKVDLPSPLVILAVRDEQSMKELAPQYWEVKNGVRPASVWVTGPNQNYIAIRTDIRDRDDVNVNPHSSAYFSYANLVISRSFSRSMPIWVSRGLAGVFSNTLVRRDDVIVGAPIPWHLESLRERRMPLRQMLAVTGTSPEFRTSDGLRAFDAQSWAFVHYLMFGDDGARATRLNAFVSRVEKGDTVDTAFAAEFGRIEDYEAGFVNYVNRSLYSAMRVKVDVALDRERFPAQPMTAVQTSLSKAAFHVAMRRSAEARRLLDEVAKADPTSAPASVLEAVMLDTGGNTDAAKAAYARAVELGTVDAYALYRFSMLSRRGADAAALERIETHLARAVEARPLFAAAHAALAEVRAELKRPQPSIVTHMQKAVILEPANPWHRIAAARVYARLNVRDEARKAAEGALKLAADDASARAEAERILALLR